MKHLDLTLPNLPTGHSTKAALGWIWGLALFVQIVGTQYMNNTTITKGLKCTRTLTLKDD